MGTTLEKAKKYKKSIIVTSLTVLATVGFTYITIRIIKNKEQPKQPFSLTKDK